MPVVPVSEAFSFRLGGKIHQSDSVTCLYRAVDAEAMATRYLMLTKDGRFAYLDRVIGVSGIYTADDWSSDRAMRFLIQHGEGDIVDEFPDIFRKRTVASPVAKVKKLVRPSKDSAAEPLLFPLQ